MIARLPIDRTQALDDLTINRRLVELLPSPKIACLQRPGQAGAGQKKYWAAMTLLASVAVEVALLSMML